MAIAELRQSLKEELELQGLKAVEYLPERFNPPIALVSASQPYVEQGQTSCSFNVSLEVTCIAAKSSNVVATDALDEMIEAVIIATGGWFIEQVGQPFMLEANNAMYFACKVKLSQEIEIGG